MKIIPREAGRVTHSGFMRTLRDAQLGEKQKAAIVGCILGDGHLRLNWSKTNYGLRIMQSKKQKEYVQWKYELLQPLSLSGPKYRKQNDSFSFSTVSHPEITMLARQFYRDGTKVIPKGIARYISDPLTIAVWFMDDGNCIRRNGRVYGYHLNTQSFTREENNILRETLSGVFGINCLLEKNHDRYRLRIMRVDDRQKFLCLIGKHILESMRYKIV